jgi:hypothetical protein
LVLKIRFDVKKTTKKKVNGTVSRTKKSANFLHPQVKHFLGCKKSKDEESADEESAASSGPPRVWRPAAPPWDVARVYARIQGRFFLGPHNGVENALTSLVKQLDSLRADGIIELHFDRAAARAGRHTGLLGCHSLRVLSPSPFLSALHRWTVRTNSSAFSSASLRLFAGRTGSHFVVNLLAELGLRPRGGPRSRFPSDPEVARNEVLWQREYVRIDK